MEHSPSLSLRSLECWHNNNLLLFPCLFPLTKNYLEDFGLEIWPWVGRPMVTSWWSPTRKALQLDNYQALIARQSQGTRMAVPLPQCTHGIYCALWGFLGIVTYKHPLYRAYIGISHRGTLVGVHPTIPWQSLSSILLLDTVQCLTYLIFKAE